MFRYLGYWWLFDQIETPQHKPAPKGLTVDVFTTAAPGEPIEMTKTSLLALKAMTYPHETYLLDDSQNPLLRFFCAQEGIRYLSRTQISHAKCGNVNFGLHQSSSEFVLIVDPDHIVVPHYLDRVLGHFEDPEIGFVQTPQVYHNIENSFVARGGAEQTYLFYGPVMMGLSGLRSALVIGTNCTFRRKALESIGLYKPGLAEDLHTSMALHAQGWKSLYVPEILARGLTPEDLGSFLHQQLKWSRGVMELLFGKAWGYARGWTLAQRLMYLLNMSYYFESIIILINLLLPLLYFCTGALPSKATLPDFALHLAPWLCVSTALFCYSQRWLRDPSEKGLMLNGLFLYLLNFPIHLLGIFYALIRREIPYLSTTKVCVKEFPFKLLGLQQVLVLLTIISLIVILSDTSAYLHATTMVLFGLWNIGAYSSAISVAYLSQQQPIQGFGRWLSKNLPTKLPKWVPVREI